LSSVNDKRNIFQNGVVEGTGIIIKSLLSIKILEDTTAYGYMLAVWIFCSFMS
jgi:hypothetical protein